MANTELTSKQITELTRPKTKKAKVPASREPVAVLGNKRYYFIADADAEFHWNLVTS